MIKDTIRILSPDGDERDFGEISLREVAAHEDHEWPDTPGLVYVELAGWRVWDGARVRVACSFVDDYHGGVVFGGTYRVNDEYAPNMLALSAPITERPSFRVSWWADTACSTVHIGRITFHDGKTFAGWKKGEDIISIQSDLSFWLSRKAYLASEALITSVDGSVRVVYHATHVQVITEVHVYTMYHAEGTWMHESGIVESQVLLAWLQKMIA